MNGFPLCQGAAIIVLLSCAFSYGSVCENVSQAVGHEYDFSGIRQFEMAAHEKRLIFEHGEPGKSGYRRLEYRPRTLEFIVDEVDTNGRVSTYFFNQRMGKLSRSPKAANLSEAELREKFSLFNEKLGVRPDFDSAVGYPELESLLKEVVARNPSQESEIHRGDYVLLEGSTTPGGLVLYELLEVGEAVPHTDRQGHSREVIRLRTVGSTLFRSSTLSFYADADLVASAPSHRPSRNLRLELGPSWPTGDVTEIAWLSREVPADRVPPVTSARPLWRLTAEEAISLASARPRETYDSSRVVVEEEGQYPKLHWTMATFLPRNGWYTLQRVEGLTEHGDPVFKSWQYHTYTGEFLMGRGRCDVPVNKMEARSDLAVVRRLLGHAPNLDRALGYSSVETSLRNILESRKPIEPSEIQVGDFILSEQRPSDSNERQFFLFEADSGPLKSGSPGETRIKRKVSIELGGGTTIRYFPGDKNPLTFNRLGADRNGEITLDSPLSREAKEYPRIPAQRAWVLSEAEAKAFATAEPALIDPLVHGAEVAAKEMVHQAIEHLQYQKWGRDHQKHHAKESEAARIFLANRYQEATENNYGRAIDALIDRVGGETFSEAAEEIFLKHLSQLHSPKFGIPTPFTTHSDTGGADVTEAQLAKDAIRNSYPLPYTMMESGKTLFNVTTLFGDVEFWNHLAKKHPSIFHRLVDYLRALPKDYMVNRFGAEALVDPVALVKQEFPEAFSLIHSVRRDFDSTTKDAILLRLSP